jgi:hypothetical protein
MGLIVASLITLTGCLVFLKIGYIWGSSVERSAAELASDKAETGRAREICLCSHAVSFHDQNGCHALRLVTEKVIVGEEDDISFDYPANRVGKRAITDEKVVDRYECPCVRYVGPNSSYLPELEGLNRGTDNAARP